MIDGIIGDPGTGKNILCVNLLKIAVNLGYQGYANFKIFDDRIELIDIKKFLDLKVKLNDRGKGAIVAIDEPYSWGLDSRSSSNEINKMMSKIGLQARKRGSDIIYITQVPTSVDYRFRYICQHIWLTHTPKDENYFYTWISRTGKTKDFKIPKSKAKEIYTWYDTLETVDAMEETENVEIEKKVRIRRKLKNAERENKD